MMPHPLKNALGRKAVPLLAGFVSCLTLQGQLIWSPDATPGGSGTWNALSTNWTGPDGESAYIRGSDLVFPEPSGSIDVQGSHAAGILEFTGAGYYLGMDNDAGSRLSLTELSGEPQFGFSGLVSAGADNYPDLNTIRSIGLEIRPVGTSRLEADFFPVLGGSPVLGITGSEGRVEYAGTWLANTGTIIPWLRLDDGGHFVITSDAELNFIKEGFFTLQLWVTGDGSGTLELGEGFVADRTEQGIEKKGIGSIRMGAGTLISHASQNLPLGYRPRPDGSAQTNGHLVFENSAGSTWLTRTNDQVYPGAVWIYRDMSVVTESNLTHVGVTEGSSNYTAWNGWSVLNAVTVTKSGNGTLTLAGEQSYAPGSSLEVLEGTLAMQSDPSAGRALGGAGTGAQLTLSIAVGGRCEWQTSGAVQSLFFDGSLMIEGRLRIENGGFAQFGGTSRTEILLAGERSDPWIQSVGPVFAGGTLVVERLPGYFPEAGAEWVFCEASGITGTWTLDNRTGMELSLEIEGGQARLVALSPAPDLPGETILEDSFTSMESHWKDLSLVPLWGSPLDHSTAFEWTGGVVRLVRSGPRDTSNHTSYNSSTGLKTFTALDHQFDQAISHSTSELTLDFRLRWPFPGDDQGESGRLMFLFNHDYPEGGLDLTPEGSPGSKLGDFSQAWWARPAYHVRLRSSTTRSGSTLLQYGGGRDAAGEYERTDNWWLPGFVSGAGGVAPAAGEDFPRNSWTRTQTGMAGDSMRTFRYRILPDRQELWRDDNDDGHLSDDELKAVMPLPLESEAPLYRYFEHFEGLRVFWNGRGSQGQVEIDWLRLKVQDNLTPRAEAGPEIFASILVEDRAPVLVDGGASTDPEDDPLLYIWLVEEDVIRVSRSPKAHLALGEGAHLLELMILDPAGNYSVDTVPVTVSLGQARPVADAGPAKVVLADNDWFGVVDLSAAGSFSPNGELVRYRWSTGPDDGTLYDGPAATTRVALGIGIHQVKLTVWDEENLFTENTVRLTIDPPSSSDPAHVIYRENFSRPAAGGEMGPWEVGWNLMRFDGEPVASVRYDGNAHRSLSGGASWEGGEYLPKVNANPTGLEFVEQNNGGHMWMNQMPFYVASPGEWMLWTEEYTLDRTEWELTEITFESTDSSPEQVKVAPAFRIGGQWYIGWDLRVETPISTSYFRSNTIDLAPTGWVLFNPSPIFTVTLAEAVDRLPEGDVTAFGLYMFKDYAWYVNRIDNVAVRVKPRARGNPYGDWVAGAFPQSVLTNGYPDSFFEADGDPDGNGWPNLLEYAMGRRPMDPSNSGSHPLLQFTGDAVVLDLPWNPDAENVGMSLYASPDLRNWQIFQAGMEQYTGDSGELRRRWSAPVDNLPQAARFFQMRASFVD